MWVEWLRKAALCKRKASGEWWGEDGGGGGCPHHVQRVCALVARGERDGRLGSALIGRGQPQRGELAGLEETVCLQQPRNSGER